MRKLRVLIGCERSGMVRRAFRALGHDAWSCDLCPSYDNDDHHILADHDLHLLDVADGKTNGKFDLGIFHPPCTRLCNSGVLRLYVGSKKAGGLDPDKIIEMEAAASFFVALWKCKIPHVGIENPIQHCHAKAVIGLDWTQTIQPFQFGHPESKRTCLWLRGIPPPQAHKDFTAARLWALGKSDAEWSEQTHAFARSRDASSRDVSWNCKCDGRAVVKISFES